MSLTRLAHSLVSKHFSDKPKGLAVDATCGNGHDTEFLARQGFTSIHGFDIQDLAIENTQQRLIAASLDNVSLHKKSHEFLSSCIGEKAISDGISCAMFNFGYLPRAADKHVTTQSTSSLKALDITLNHLRPEGLICLICYPGHPEGAIETKNIKHWLTELAPTWSVTQHNSNPHKPDAPILFTISHTVSSHAAQ